MANGKLARTLLPTKNNNLLVSWTEKTLGKRSAYLPVMCSLIGHFRVHLRLHFKARLSAKSLLWKTVFIHIEIGSNYHNENFALRLALKERLRRTRKWPIHGIIAPHTTPPLIIYDLWISRCHLNPQSTDKPCLNHTKPYNSDCHPPPKYTT